MTDQSRTIDGQRQSDTFWGISSSIERFLILAIIPPFLFTESRASYLGLIVVCFAMGLLTQHRTIITGFILIALLLSPLFLPQEVKDRILFTFTQQAESGQVQIGDIRLDTSTSARIANLKDCIIFKITKLNKLNFIEGFKLSRFLRMICWIK